jgi:hypothetical protein
MKLFNCSRASTVPSNRAYHRFSSTSKLSFKRCRRFESVVHSRALKFKSLFVVCGRDWGNRPQRRGTIGVLHNSGERIIICQIRSLMHKFSKLTFWWGSAWQNVPVVCRQFRSPIAQPGIQLIVTDRNSSLNPKCLALRGRNTTQAKNRCNLWICVVGEC